MNMKTELRLHADDGLWCSFLLPLAFFINCLKDYAHNTHETNFILCILSFGTLIVIFENKCHLFTNCMSQLPVLRHSYLLLIAFCTIILQWWTVYNLYFLLLITFTTAWVFDYVYHLLLVKCPRSFTFGEAAIVAQGTTLFIISCFFSWYNEIYGARDDFRAISLESRFFQILTIGSILLLWIQYMNKCLQSIYPFYATCIVLGLIMYGSWIIVLNQDPILWFLSICIKSKNRIILMCFWIILTAASVLFVVHQNLNEKQASSKNRKYFHIIIIFVFLPGVLLDLEFLYLATVGTLCIFVVLEMFRILEIPPLGPLLQNSFQLFLDEKDSGFLILTHIYLLIGCSCPLWLHMGKIDDICFHISLLSGIISVGIGDTIAAVAGSHFGKHKWPGSEKTFEGTLFAIIAQIAFAMPILLSFNGLHVWWNLLILLITIVFTSFLEANTNQVDNFVLPLFMYLFLCIIQ